MQLIEWHYKNLVLPLIRTESGTRYCTTQGLCSALEMNVENLRKTLNKNKNRIDAVTVTDTHGHGELSGVSTFLRAYRQQFGIRAVPLLFSIKFYVTPLRG